MLPVSVIIPTLNGEKYLGKLFGTLQEQSVSPAQILVVDSSSQDDTLKICGAFGVDIIQIEAKTFDHGGTRNHSVPRATGDILVFMTQDAFFRDSISLENLIKPLDDPKVAASYGRQIPKKDANPIEAFVRCFNYPSAGMTKEIGDLPRLGVKTFFFSNACSAVKKTAFIEVGGFPNKTIMNEDMFLAAKLLQIGYKITYQADAVVYHSHNYSLVTQFKRNFDIGVFFNRNRWIKNLTKPGEEGIKYLKEELRFLAANRQWGWIPYAFVDTTSRFLGYQIGLLEKGIPLWLKKKMSYNTKFWEAKVSSFGYRDNLTC